MEMSTSTVPRNSRLKPASVLLYNKKMNGVDHVDQMLANYSANRRGLKWYKKFFFHLLDLAINNAFILYKNERRDTKMTLKQFILKLIDEILEKNGILGQENSQSQVGRTNTRTVTASNSHYPLRVTENGKTLRSNCVNCYSKGKKRTATPYSCTGCGKRLCIDGPKSCFEEFHRKSG